MRNLELPLCIFYKDTEYFLGNQVIFKKNKNHYEKRALAAYTSSQGSMKLKVPSNPGF